MILLNNIQENEIIEVLADQLNKQSGLAHSLLVYVNLITGGDARNKDAASRLYTK